MVSEQQLVFGSQACHVGAQNRPPRYCNIVQVFKEVLCNITRNGLLFCLIISCLEKTIFDFITLSKIVPKDRNIKLKIIYQSLQYLRHILGASM